MATEVRIDKWLWAVRLYKTRTIAAEACRKGQVSLGGVNLKPSRMVKVGEVISVRKPPIILSFRILQAIENRVSAKLVPEMLEDVTPPEQYELLELSKIGGFVDRARGTGRPTKKERRDLDSFLSDDFFDIDD
ncbi:MAG: RNA-binding S4 domain-containing protein [Bacteroidales bacterium]|nr:RNA-binding S4 domain-containing protein [Bacteroidales bacterium]